MRAASRLRWAGLVAAVYVAIGVAAVLAPATVLDAAAKEGPIESLSHAVLAGGIAAWAVRARVRPRWPALAVAILLALTLAEELDWGAHLGHDAFARVLVDRTGAPNLHNALGGTAYVLFALPWAAFWLAPFAPERWRVALGDHLPARSATFAAVVVAGASLLSSLAAAPWERALEEIHETIHYVLVAVAAFRPRSGS